MSAASSAPGQTIARSAVHRPSEVWSSTAVAALPHREDARLDQSLGELLRQAVDRRAHVDRAAEFVKQGLILRRREDRQRRHLIIAPDAPRRNARRLERGGPLCNVRPADQHALAAQQRHVELLLEPPPLATRPHGQPNEPLVVMPVPKDPGAPGRLAGTRRSSLEHPAIDAAPLQRITRRQPGDPTAYNG